MVAMVPASGGSLSVSRGGMSPHCGMVMEMRGEDLGAVFDVHVGLLFITSRD